MIFLSNASTPDNNIFIDLQGQIHLLGNIVVWYSGAFAVLVYMAFAIFYLLRRRRLCYDIDESKTIIRRNRLI